MKLELSVPRWSVPLLQPARYKGAWGGRAGGKGYFFADQLIKDSIATRGQLTCCLREIQNTLSESSKRLIESRLAFHGITEAHGFKIWEKTIQTPGDGLMIFRGMRDFNSESIKSLEGYGRFWWDEAQNASAGSLKMLRPTVRAAGAEMWFSWNPKEPPDKEHPETSIDGFFGRHLVAPELVAQHVAALPGGGVLANCNFYDNPWLPESMVQEETHDRTHRSPEDYANIWKGAYQTRSEARVFQNWQVRPFEIPANAIRRQGADFGFSVDPSVIVQMFIGRWDGDVAVADENGRDLFIRHEAYAVGCDVDFTPALFAGELVAGPGNAWNNRNPFNYRGLPEAVRWPITADSARPESISYLQRHGLPLTRAAKKGAGSVEEGIEFLKAYSIWLHPECTHSIDEFTFYSWKTDPKTGLILPVLEDKKNHVIDASRYALEDVRRGRGFFT